MKYLPRELERTICNVFENDTCFNFYTEPFLSSSIYPNIMMHIVYCRRIAYQESTQSFGVITTRIEIKDTVTGKTVPTHPSVSVPATSMASMGGGDAAMPSSSKTADKIPYGEEIELCSLIVIDQHTFEGKLYSFII